jgi:hypothetical protein
MDWFSVKPPGTREPEWKFCAAIDDNGAVFAPAAIAGNEQSVMLCAAFDGISAVINKRHIYLPTEWLAKEYPAMADVFSAIERRVRSEHVPYQFQIRGDDKDVR